MNSLSSTISRFARINVLTLLFIAGVVTKACGYNSVWVITLLFFSLYLGIREFSSWANTRLPLAFLVTSSIMLISTLLGNSNNSEWVTNIGYVSSFCMLMFVCYILVMSRDESYFIAGLRQVGVVLLLFAIFGIYEYIIRDNPLSEYFETYYNLAYVGSDRFRSCSVFSHSIPFAVSTLIGIIITYYFAKSQWKWIEMFIFVVALFCTQARSCWIVFLLVVVGIALTELKTRGFNRWALVIIPFAIAAIFFVGQPVIDAVVNRFSGLMSSGSFLHRSGATDYILQNFFANGNLLIGSGYGSAEYEMSKTVIFEEGFNTVDNGLATLLYDFGLVVIGLVIAALCCTLIRLFSDQSNNVLKCFSLIMLVSLATGYVFEFFGWQCVSVFFFISLAYTIYHGRRVIKRKIAL